MLEYPKEVIISSHQVAIGDGNYDWEEDTITIDGPATVHMVIPFTVKDIANGEAYMVTVKDYIIYKKKEIEVGESFPWGTYLYNMDKGKSSRPLKCFEDYHDAFVWAENYSLM